MERSLDTVTLLLSGQVVIYCRHHATDDEWSGAGITKPLRNDKSSLPHAEHEDNENNDAGRVNSAGIGWVSVTLLCYLTFVKFAGITDSG